jgi:hypothetical protein
MKAAHLVVLAFKHSNRPCTCELNVQVNKCWMNCPIPILSAYFTAVAPGRSEAAGVFVCSGGRAMAERTEIFRMYLLDHKLLTIARPGR